MTIILAMGCRTNKALVKPIKDRSPSFLTKRLEKSLFEYESLSFKTDVTVKMKDEKRSFKANVRVKKDSAIWMSISPALGIEVARAIFTEDSIKLVDKWNDQYYLGDYDYINNIFDAEFDFQMLQDLMVANPVMYDVKEKFVATKDYKDYILTSKNKRKVRKALGLDKSLLKEESESQKDTLRFNVNTRKLRKAITKENEEDLVVKRYWINPGTYKLDKTIIRDLYYNRTFKVEYLKYDEVALMEFPDETEIVLEDDDNTTKVQMENSRVRVNKSLKFPFVIPEKFERIQ